jgi:hypothetical protein
VKKHTNIVNAQERQGRKRGGREEKKRGESDGGRGRERKRG